MTNTHVINLSDFASLLLWYSQEVGGHEANHSLLCHSLPQGRLIRATLASGQGGSPHIAAVFQDQQDGSERTPRLFNPAGYFVLRWLLLPGAAITMSRTDLPPRRERHYVTVFDHIQVQRVIAGARPGQLVKQLGDHHDLTRSNLTLMSADDERAVGRILGHPHKGRQLAIQSALLNLAAAAEDFRAAGLPPIGAEFYLSVLEGGFRLLDAIPLGGTKAVEEAAE